MVDGETAIGMQWLRMGGGERVCFLKGEGTWDKKKKCAFRKFSEREGCALRRGGLFDIWELLLEFLISEPHPN